MGAGADRTLVAVLAIIGIMFWILSASMFFMGINDWGIIRVCKAVAGRYDNAWLAGCSRTSLVFMAISVLLMLPMFLS
jgi:hypothetical protein